MGSRLLRIMIWKGDNRADFDGLKWIARPRKPKLKSQCTCWIPATRTASLYTDPSLRPRISRETIGRKKKSPRLRQPFLHEVPATNETGSIRVALFALELSQYSIPAVETTKQPFIMHELDPSICRQQTSRTFVLSNGISQRHRTAVTPQLHDSVAVQKQPWCFWSVIRVS